MVKNVKILVVEDSFEDAALYEIYLNKCRRREYEISLASTGHEGLRKIEEETFDCIILDQVLTDTNAREFILSLNLEEFPTPIVIITGFSDPSFENEVLNLGVADYLDKSEVTPITLERTILHAIERQVLVQKLKKANQAKNKFISEVAREIKRPIETLINYCDSFFHSKEENRSPGHLISIIQYLNETAKEQRKSLDRLLARSLLDLSSSPLFLEKVELSVMLKDLFEKYRYFAEKKELEFYINCDPEMIVTVDREKLLTAIDCILDNALKFTDFGSIKVRAKLRDQRVEIEVEDTGVGILPVHREKIFSPYTHGDQKILEKFGGLGNGLAIAKQIIEMHGGSISVKSIPEKGSLFRISLPLQKQVQKEESDLTKILI